MPYDIFLSHSHVDNAFAKQLAGLLKAAHLSVWIDDYGMRPGDEVEPILKKALEESRHAVFVVTKAWLDGRWTRGEVEYFLRLRQTSEERRVLIPLLRGVEELPLYLTGIHYLPWSAENDAEPYALFWQLLCGLTGQELGNDENEWAEKGRRACGLGPNRGPVLLERTPEEASFKASKRIQWGGEQYALSCDRSEQWGDLSTEVVNPNDEAIFVVGPQGRAHDRFLQRIELCLDYPDDRIKKVKWSKKKRAMTQRAFKARLARAVGCKGDDENLDAELEAMLADALRVHNLVLLHRPVCTHEIRNESFVSYYTEVLPELIARVRRRAGKDRGGIKIVQAVAWDEPSPLKARLAGLLRRFGMGGTWVRRAREQREARGALERICREAEARGLTVLPLRELEEITKEHVKELSRRVPAKFLKPEDREEFVEDVMHGKDSDQVFTRITEWLKEDDDEGGSQL